MPKSKPLFCAVMLVFTISLSNFGEKHAPLQVTKKLPIIDKVKILKVIPAELGIRSIEAKRVLKGKDAEVFASLWRNQKLLPISSDCHRPGFEVKLFAKGELLADASLCWECNTIEFFTPQLSGSFYQGFAGESKKGQEMLEFLKNAF